MTPSYNLALVAASLMVAVVASYTALTMAARVATATGSASRLWLLGGSFAMGFGIWAMHFVGMLAFDLPIPLGYDLQLTAASLVVAILASAFALWLVCQATLPWRRLAGGSLLLGTGICAMHYTGMAALRMHPAIHYDPAWFTASLAIAVLASCAALWLAFRLRGDAPHAMLLRIGAACLMGCAIVGMHYTGMGAAEFAPDSLCQAAGAGVDDGWLAALVIGASLSVLGFALVVAVLDARMQERTSKLAASLAAANEQLLQMALHDQLTRLPNRALMQDRIEQALKKIAREGGCFAVMLLDLDGFKAVNDGYGHQMGDRLLIEVADRIRQALRAEDTVARLGGDEFVVLAQTGAKEDAALIAAKIVERVEQPYALAAEPLHVSASIGIALSPGDGTHAAELLANADAAMYQVKEAGRNGFLFFAPSMNAGVEAQRVLVQQLRRAIEAGQLLLHYQPKYRTSDGSLAGLEALVRWLHPQRGLLHPADFIAAAEKGKLAVRMGNWVIAEACRQLRAWRDDPAWQSHQPQSWSVAVNLFPAQLADPSLVATVREALAAHGLLPRWLTLEISESAILRDEERARAALDELARLGVSIAIDNFGTGTSSLLYLKQLPARELKISRAFVGQLGQASSDAAVVASLVVLARSLRLRVVAEGVETAAQQALLSAAGCDELQGFRLGKPASGSELALCDPSSVLSAGRIVGAIGSGGIASSGFGSP